MKINAEQIVRLSPLAVALWSLCAVGLLFLFVAMQPACEAVALHFPFAGSVEVAPWLYVGLCVASVPLLALAAAWLLFYAKFTRLIEFSPVPYLMTLLSAAYICCPPTINGLVITWIVVLMLMIVATLWKRDDVPEQSYLCGILCALGGIMDSDFLLVLPLVWILFGIMRSFSLRIFLASLVGVAMVWLLSATGLWLLGEQVADIGQLQDVVLRGISSRWVVMAVPAAVVLMNMAVHSSHLYSLDMYSRSYIASWFTIALWLLLIGATGARTNMMLAVLLPAGMQIVMNNKIRPTWLGAAAYLGLPIALLALSTI